ncbi:unnamed protein product [Larinioides sclopetarius]|uniref:Uncharacterized protein n=2 Tax=Larinioides sclopetarius TaxID=280406 RepID=A0AAV2AQ60_9ARAC
MQVHHTSFVMYATNVSFSNLNSIGTTPFTVK